MMLLVEKPDLQAGIGDEGNAHDSQEQENVFAEKSAAVCGRPDPASDPQDRFSEALDHSITSSARSSSASGTSRPRVFAVLRLMTSSVRMGRMTGKSAGFAPLRIR